MKNLLLSVIFLTFLLSGCSKNSTDSSVPNEITLTKLDGSEVTAKLHGQNRMKNVTFSEAEGKVVLAVYWSTSCPPCRAEIPHLIDLQKKYAEKVKVIGFLVEDATKEEVKDFAEYFGMNYDILYGQNNYVMADVMGGVRGIPAMFLYDKQGKQVKHYVGLIPPEMIEAEIEKLL